MNEWRKILIKSLVFGSGFGVTFAVLSGTLAWYFYHPKPLRPWNRSAIKASYYKVESANDELVFEYDLENTTSQDLRLSGPDKADLALRLSDGSLSGFGSENVRLQAPIYVPAKEKTRIKVEITGYSIEEAGSLEVADDPIAEFMALPRKQQLSTLK